MDIIQGECPVCGVVLEHDLQIKGNDFAGQGAYYDSFCPACGWRGKEQYYLDFCGYISEDLDKYSEDEFIIA